MYPVPVPWMSPCETDPSSSSMAYNPFLHPASITSNSMQHPNPMNHHQVNHRHVIPSFTQFFLTPCSSSSSPPTAAQPTAASASAPTPSPSITTKTSCTASTSTHCYRTTHHPNTNTSTTSRLPPQPQIENYSDPPLPVPHPPPMNKIAEFSAQMICYLWFAEPNTRSHNQHFLPQVLSPASSPTTSPPASASPPNITQAQLVPNPEFVMFIQNLLNTTQVSHSVVLLALFYIHRLKSLNPIKPNSKSEYRIGVVSLMLANKMLDDHTYTAKTWSEVSRLPLNSLNDGEIEFLKGLNFELHVNICDFSAWFKLLHGMVHLKDRHTAIALASGPRTRWFKKMRVASGEGLSVLEGLISPIRNSKIMKTFEVEKQQTFRAPPPRREHLEPCTRFQASPIRIQPQQPTHPYNLRRSTRPMVISSTHTTPIQQFPRWDGSPSSVSSNYSAILPCNALSMTPQQQMELRERHITSLPPKTRSMQYPNAGYPTRLNTNSSKRNLTEFLSSQQDLKLPTEDGLNSRNKRLSSSISTSTTTTSSSSSRIPSAATTIHTTPSSQQLLSHQLAPVITSTQGTAHGTYLANAIMPLQHQHHHNTNTQPESRPKLCFRSIVAGRRGGNEEVVVARHENGLPASYMVTSNNNNNNDRFMVGTPVGSFEDMNQNKMRTNWFYSNFSNAGVPGVVWADRAANQPPNNQRPLSGPSDHMDTRRNSFLVINSCNSLPLPSSDDDLSSLWHLNHHRLHHPFQNN